MKMKLSAIFAGEAGWRRERTVPVHDRWDCSSESLKDRKAAILGSGRLPEIVSMANQVCGPEMRITATPDGKSAAGEGENRLAKNMVLFHFIQSTPTLEP